MVYQTWHLIWHLWLQCGNGSNLFRTSLYWNQDFFWLLVRPKNTVQSLRKKCGLPYLLRLRVLNLIEVQLSIRSNYLQFPVACGRDHSLYLRTNNPIDVVYWWMKKDRRPDNSNTRLTLLINTQAPTNFLNTHFFLR